MKEIEVVAAVIINEGFTFAVQRGYGEFKGWWEFPGGKVEKGETHEEALRREIKEELNTEIEVGNKIKTIEYDYPNFHLILHCYFCKIIKGTLELSEHDNSIWLDNSMLLDLKWLPADIEIVKEIQRFQSSK